MDSNVAIELKFHVINIFSGFVLIKLTFIKEINIHSNKSFCMSFKISSILVL